MNTSDAIFKEELRNLRHATDPDQFNASLLRAKTKISKLISENQFNHVEAFSRTLLGTIERIHEKDDAFILSVVHNFPVNSKATFSLLGKSDLIDSHIISHKLVIEDFCASEDKDYLPLLNWATDNNQQEIVENLLIHIADNLDCNHKDSLKLKQTVLKHLLRSILWDEDRTSTLPNNIDIAMARIADIEDSSELDIDVIHGLVKCGLNSTLMTLICRSRFMIYKGSERTPTENARFYKALPEEPTIKELVNMHLYTDKPGLSNFILFDENVNITEFVNLIKSLSPPKWTKFSLDNMEPFAEIATKENINTPERRKRVEFLFNSLCDHLTDQAHGTYGSPADVMEGMEKLGFDTYLFKICKRFRAQHLENELGM